MKNIPGYIVTFWMVFVILVLSQMSCETISIELESQDYVIEKGEHYSTIILKDWGGSIVQDWILDESCIYELGNDNQGDWNKLTGLVYKSHIKVHDYSCRVVWRWSIEKGMFELGYYAYENSQRINPSFVGWYVSPNQEFRTNVTDMGDRWRVAIESHDFDLMVYHKIEKQSRNKGHYKVLTPYFGGDETAPHRMTLRSKLITIHRE